MLPGSGAMIGSQLAAKNPTAVNPNTQAVTAAPVVNTAGSRNIALNQKAGGIQQAAPTAVASKPAPVAPQMYGSAQLMGMKSTPTAPVDAQLTSTNVGGINPNTTAAKPAPYNSNGAAVAGKKIVPVPAT